MQNRHDRLGDLRIVVICINIDEVCDAVMATAWPPRPAAAGGAAQEAAPGKGRQMALARHAEKSFQDPAHRPACQAAISDGCEHAGKGREALRPRQCPIEAVQAMLRHVGCLHFQHQLASVHLCGAFDAAHAAVHAQVGDVAHFVGRQLPRVDVLLQQVTQQVGFGARRGRLRVRRPEQRAHALARRLGPAIAAAVAVEGFGLHLARLPAQRPVLGLRRRDQALPERPGRHARIGADNFPRIETLVRIENRFELTKDRKEPAVLPGDPRRAGQARPVLRADRSA